MLDSRRARYHSARAWPHHRETDSENAINVLTFLHHCANVTLAPSLNQHVTNQAGARRSVPRGRPGSSQAGTKNQDAALLANCTLTVFIRGVRSRRRHQDLARLARDSSLFTQIALGSARYRARFSIICNPELHRRNSCPGQGLWRQPRHARFPADESTHHRLRQQQLFRNVPYNGHGRGEQEEYVRGLARRQVDRQPPSCNLRHRIVLRHLWLPSRVCGRSGVSAEVGRQPTAEQTSSQQPYNSRHSDRARQVSL